ncbi:MAG: sigma-70 family RNA polymerase sigma factor [Planctomycetes bacterium]|nr:sigma-70 family RNA polymerase sigma factor [Planctomycetota bacterium]
MCQPREFDPYALFTDEELIAEYNADCQEAFTTLVRRYEQELSDFLARGMCGSARNAIADLCRDTRTVVLAHSDSFTGGEDGFRSWLFTIAKLVKKNHWKTHHKHRYTPIDEVPEPPEDDESPVDLPIDEAIWALPEKLQLVVRRRFYYGWEFDEIGLELHVSSATARRWFKKAQLRLFEILSTRKEKKQDDREPNGRGTRDRAPVGRHSPRCASPFLW